MYEFILEWLSKPFFAYYRMTYGIGILDDIKKRDTERRADWEDRLARVQIMDTKRYDELIKGRAKIKEQQKQIKILRAVAKLPRVDEIDRLKAKRLRKIARMIPSDYRLTRFDPARCHCGTIVHPPCSYCESGDYAKV